MEEDIVSQVREKGFLAACCSSVTIFQCIMFSFLQAIHAARGVPAADEAFLPTDHESSFSSGQQRRLGEERVLEQANYNGGGSLDEAATMPQAGPASSVQSSAQQQQQQQVHHQQQQKHFAVKTKPPSPNGEEHRAGSPRTKVPYRLCCCWLVCVSRSFRRCDRRQEGGTVCWNGGSARTPQTY